MGDSVKPGPWPVVTATVSAVLGLAYLLRTARLGLRPSTVGDLDHLRAIYALLAEEWAASRSSA